MDSKHANVINVWVHGFFLFDCKLWKHFTWVRD